MRFLNASETHIEPAEFVGKASVINPKAVQDRGMKIA
jgi:hypothetical protein